MSLRNRLKNQLRDRQFRHAYADEQLNLSIATQIKVIRESQNMSQAALAGKIGTKQAGVSRIESANYDGWSIAILRRLADAFDLRLRVSFEEFGTLWKDVDDFGRESLLRKEFKEDPEFKEAEQSIPQEIAALAPAHIKPAVPTEPRLSDLMASVVQQNEEVRKAWIAAMDISPIIDAFKSQLQSQEAPWRTAIAEMTSMTVHQAIQSALADSAAQFESAMRIISTPSFNFDFVSQQSGLPSELTPPRGVLQNVFNFPIKGAMPATNQDSKGILQRRAA